MNTPARFETLLWMASPMMAWSQAGNENPAPKPTAIKRATASATGSAKVTRKRRKAVA